MSGSKYSSPLKILIYLVVLGPQCCEQAFSSSRELKLLSIVMHRLLIEVASHVVEHGL